MIGILLELVLFYDSIYMKGRRLNMKNVKMEV